MSDSQFDEIFEKLGIVISDIKRNKSNGGKRKARKTIRKNKNKNKTRKWSQKYKKSINCRNPKGFSQKQYCKYGRKK
jgi:hypothetical protein